MQLDILGKGLPISPALSAHTQNRTRTAVDRFADRIRRVVIRLFDVNAHRGGEDKVCRIEAVLPGSPKPVFVQAIDRDAYVAVDRATTSLKQTIARHVKRLTHRRRAVRRAKPS